VKIKSLGNYRITNDPLGREGDRQGNIMNENVGSILLGTIIANAEYGAVFPDGITVSMFESPKDRAIFTAASEMIRDEVKPNLVLLRERLQETGKLEAAGGADYIASLTSLPETYTSQIGRYGELLKRQAENREAVLAVKEAAKKLDKPGSSPELIIPDLQKHISGYGEGNIWQPFRFSRLGSIAIKPVSWLVNGLIEANSFSTLYGDSGAGKSFLAIELAACIATATPFHGKPVKQGPVIYMAGEGHSGLARRFKAWSIVRGVSLEKAPLFLSEGAIALINPTVMGPVCGALDKLIKEIGQNPALVILDTWSRVLGGDDSAPSDAAAGVAALDGLRAKYGNFAAMVVHHEGHQKGRGRGWSGLRAAVDMEYRAERGADGLLRLECTKAKDTSVMDPMAFQFMGVALSIRNESGEPITSAVLNKVDCEPAPKSDNKTANLGKNQAKALDILKRMVTTGQVSEEAWRGECQTAGLNRNSFWNAKKGLEKNGFVQVSDGFVCCKGVGLSVENRGLLYSPPVSTNASTPITPVENNTNSTLFNAFNGSKSEESLPPEVLPEYRECYDLALADFLNTGYSRELAELEAMEAVKEFAAQAKAAS
jgi:hypothetical protein